MNRQILASILLLTVTASPVFASERFSGEVSGPLIGSGSERYYKLSACSDAIVLAFKNGRTIAPYSLADTSIESDGKTVKASCTIYNLKREKGVQK